MQALASLLAIITFLIVLNVQRSMLIPGGVLGMSIWLLYLILKEPTNVILATFIAAVIGSCISQIMSILYKNTSSCVCFWPSWLRWYQGISLIERLHFL